MSRVFNATALRRAVFLASGGDAEVAGTGRQYKRSIPAVRTVPPAPVGEPVFRANAAGDESLCRRAWVALRESPGMSLEALAELVGEEAWRLHAALVQRPEIVCRVGWQLYARCEEVRR